MKKADKLDTNQSEWNMGMEDIKRISHILFECEAHAFSVRKGDFSELTGLFSAVFTLYENLKVLIIKEVLNDCIKEGKTQYGLTSRIYSLQKTYYNLLLNGSISTFSMDTLIFSKKVLEMYGELLLRKQQAGLGLPKKPDFGEKRDTENYM